MTRSALALAGLLGLGLRFAAAAGPPAPAPASQDPAPAATRPAGDHDAPIRAGAVEYAKAFDAADAQALAARFTADARMVLPDGRALDGRAAIAERFAAVFADQPGLKLAVQIDDLRRAGADTVVESGTATITAPDGETQVTPFTAIHVRQDGRWLLAELRESEPVAPRVGRLDDLAWLLGDWIEEGPDAVVSFTGAWEDPERRQFLIRKWAVKVQGQVVLSGTHRLGYDADRGVVRGWLFDSEGGFSEETWSRTGADRWLVQGSGVDADGLRAGSTHLVVRDGDHRARIEVLARTLAGRAVTEPDTRILARPPAPPASPTQEPKR